MHKLHKISPGLFVLVGSPKLSKKGLKAVSEFKKAFKDFGGLKATIARLEEIQKTAKFSKLDVVITKKALQTTAWTAGKVVAISALPYELLDRAGMKAGQVLLDRAVYNAVRRESITGVSSAPADFIIPEYARTSEKLKRYQEDLETIENAKVAPALNRKNAKIYKDNLEKQETLRAVQKNLNDDLDAEKAAATSPGKKSKQERIARTKRINELEDKITKNQEAIDQIETANASIPEDPKIREND